MIENDYKLKKLEKYKEEALRETIYNSNNIKKYKCCPHCGSNNFIKFGKYNGIQRYRCQNSCCKKTFSNTTNSVWKYLKHKPEKWLSFIELMGENETLANCAFKLDISIVTAFNWRHKILHAIENNYKPYSFKELVNLKTYFTCVCYKGSRNKHFTYEEIIKNKIDKLYCSFPCDVTVFFASEGDDLPLITTVMPKENINESFKNKVLNIIEAECYIHQERINKHNIMQSLIDHNKNLPYTIKRKFDFKIDNGKIQYIMKDNVKEDKRNKTLFSSLNPWIHKFHGVATKYVCHYYNFFSLIHSQKHYDFMKLFFELLQNGIYTSVENLRLNHLENY